MSPTTYSSSRVSVPHVPGHEIACLHSGITHWAWYSGLRRSRTAVTFSILYSNDFSANVLCSLAKIPPLACLSRCFMDGLELIEIDSSFFFFGTNITSTLFTVTLAEANVNMYVISTRASRGSRAYHRHPRPRHKVYNGRYTSIFNMATTSRRRRRRLAVP